MIKLFAFDLDGTLLDKSSNLRDENIKAIKKLNEAGVKTILASGRVFSSINYFQEKIGIDNPIIACNGSIIALNSDNFLKNSTLSDDLLERLYNFCLDYKLNFHFYDKDCYYSNRLKLDRIKHLENRNDYGRNYQVNLAINNNPVLLLDLLGSKANKFQITDLTNHKLDRKEVLSMLKAEFKEEITITASAESQLEIMGQNVSKWESLRELLIFWV